MSVNTFKLLGRSRPGASSNTTAYTAPASTTTLLNELTICNTDATGASDVVRVFVVPNAGAAGISNAVIYGLPIPNGNPIEANVSVTLNTGDFLVVFSTNGTSTFTASGMEITSPTGPTHKNFGRANPGAGATSTLYTAPAATTSLLTSLMVANTGSGADSFQVFLVPQAGAAGVSNAVAYNVVVPPGNSFAMNLPLVFMTGDFLVVEAAQGNLTFTASGLEGV